MYTNVSNEFKEKIKSKEITSTAKLVFTEPNLTLIGKATDTTLSSLQELKITNNCYDKGKLIGTTSAKEVEINIINKDNLDLADKEFALFLGLKIDNDIEYIPYGNFIVTDYKDMKHNSIFRIIAYDYMTKLNPSFKDNTTFTPTFPISLKDFKTQFLASYDLQCENQTLPNDNFQIDTMPRF